jgi:ABC-2 type transport system permease protein
VTTLSLGVSRAGVELRTFFRQRDTVAFTFSLPVVILLVLGSVLNFRVDGISGGQLLTAGLIAGGVASTSFVNLAVGIANDRDNGTLKRLQGMPLPPASYFFGKIGLVAVASLAESAIMLVVGRFAFDLQLPTSAGVWLTFAWVFALGVTGCSLLGVALTSLTRTSSGAAAMANLVLIVLQFISGVYVQPLRNLPAPLTFVASLFPIKWMAQGFRSVFLPDSLAGIEMAGTWEHGRTALVLGAWCIGGLVLCLATFRWRGRADR